MHVASGDSRPSHKPFRVDICGHRPSKNPSVSGKLNPTAAEPCVGRSEAGHPSKIQDSDYLRQELGTTSPRLLQFIRDSIPTQHCCGTTKPGGAGLTRMKE